MFSLLLQLVFLIRFFPKTFLFLSWKNWIEFFVLHFSHVCIRNLPAKQLLIRCSNHTEQLQTPDYMKFKLILLFYGGAFRVRLDSEFCWKSSYIICVFCPHQACFLCLFIVLRAALELSEIVLSLVLTHSFAAFAYSFFTLFTFLCFIAWKSLRNFFLLFSFAWSCFFLPSWVFSCFLSLLFLSKMQLSFCFFDYCQNIWMILAGTDCRVVDLFS